MQPLVNMLLQAINLYCIIIFVWAILSWLQNVKWASDLRKVLDVIVNPYVDLFKRFIKPMGGVDFTPFIAMIVLQLVSGLLVRMLSIHW